MLNINKIDSDINYKNLTKIEISEIIKAPYTTTIHRIKTGSWLPNDIERLADYFGRTIAYYFDREEKEIIVYKNEEKQQVVEESKPCSLCAEKTRTIAVMQETINYQRELLMLYKKTEKSNQEVSETKNGE